MIARLDEFDSLTPLMVTPGSMSGDEEPLVGGATSMNHILAGMNGQTVRLEGYPLRYLFYTLYVYPFFFNLPLSSLFLIIDNVSLNLTMFLND